MKLYKPSDTSMIAHTRQPPKFGCACCAYFAVTNDLRFLNHMTESQSHRMAAHAHGYGYVVYSMFNGSGLVTMPRALVDNLISQMESTYTWSFVLTVDSLTTPGQLHSVGAVFFFEQEHKHKFRVCVSDSQLDLLSVYDYKEFFESPYSRIYELEVVGIPSVILLEPALTEQEVLNHLRNYSETRFSIYDQMIKIKEHNES